MAHLFVARTEILVRFPHMNPAWKGGIKRWLYLQYDSVSDDEY